MTAREYFNRPDLPLNFIFLWNRENTGILFYNRYNREDKYFLPKEQAVTIFDALKFIARHNLEDYKIAMPLRQSRSE